MERRVLYNKIDLHEHFNEAFCPAATTTTTLSPRTGLPSNTTMVPAAGLVCFSAAKIMDKLLCRRVPANVHVSYRTSKERRVSCGNVARGNRDPIFGCLLSNYVFTRVRVEATAVSKVPADEDSDIVFGTPALSPAPAVGIYAQLKG